MALGHSQEWHDRRSRGVGGSEVAAIMGKSPYRSCYAVWLDKTRRQPPKDISHLPHVLRGTLGEESCRMLLERKMLKAIRPKTWQGDKEWHLCSDDGFIHETGEILEIKCMGKANHEAAGRGEIPEAYVLQCQWNLFVSKALKCLFVSYVPETEEMHLVEVYPNPELQADIERTVDYFWLQNVKADVPPPAGDKDYVTIADPKLDALMDEYGACEDELRRAELKTGIAHFVRHQPAICCSRGKVLRYKRGESWVVKIMPTTHVAFED